MRLNMPVLPQTRAGATPAMGCARLMDDACLKYALSPPFEYIKSPPAAKRSADLGMKSHPSISPCSLKASTTASRGAQQACFCRCSTTPCPNVHPTRHAQPHDPVPILDRPGGTSFRPPIPSHQRPCAWRGLLCFCLIKLGGLSEVSNPPMLRYFGAPTK